MHPKTNQKTKAHTPMWTIIIIIVVIAMIAGAIIGAITSNDGEGILAGAFMGGIGCIGMMVNILLYIVGILVSIGMAVLGFSFLAWLFLKIFG